MFSDILLTVDFDRTLTDTRSRIPQRNIEAIRYFIENGGAFTINTGRSFNTYRAHLEEVPTNAPLLLYNGSAAWEKGKLINTHIIDLDMWQVLDKMRSLFPDMNLEVQSDTTHYLINPRPAGMAYYHEMGWDYEIPEHGQDLGPFLKFCLFGDTHATGRVADLYEGTEEDLRYVDHIEDTIRELYGDKVDVFRSAPRILDMHAKGVSKCRAARELQAALGRKILVCVGDAQNDSVMLKGADYAFCPSDGVIAADFPNVCPCAEGAVADVIYEKIPEILGNRT